MILSEELKEESDKLEDINLLLIEGVGDKALIDKRLINMIMDAIKKILLRNDNE